MNSDKLHARVQYLEQKTIQLLEGYKKQHEVIQRLQEENEQLIQQVAGKEVSEPDLPGGLGPATVTQKEHRSKNWNKRLNNYINAIDKSIAYLEKLR